MWMLCASVSCPVQVANDYDFEVDFDGDGFDYEDDTDPDMYISRQQEPVMRAVAKLPHLQDLAVCDDVGGTHIRRLAHAGAFTRLEVVCHGG